MPSKTPPATSVAPVSIASATQPRTRSVERPSISAATLVSGERGSPTTICSTRGTSLARNSDRTDASTSTRCTEMQAWPDA